MLWMFQLADWVIHRYIFIKHKAKLVWQYVFFHTSYLLGSDFLKNNGCNKWVFAVCLSISVGLSVCQFISLSVSLSVCLLVYLSVCLSISLSLQYVYIAGQENKMSWSCPVGAQVPFCAYPEQIFISLTKNKILQLSSAVRVNFWYLTKSWG